MAEFKKVRRNRKKYFENRKVVWARLSDAGYNSLERYAEDKAKNKTNVIREAIEEKLERENYFISKMKQDAKENRKIAEEEDNG